jgi:hypothetical protein
MAGPHRSCEARLGCALEALARQGRLKRVVKLTLALRFAAFAGLSFVAAPAPLAGQTAAQSKVPWAVGEHLEYTVRIIGLKSGVGVMQVTGVDTMRGHPSWRLHFNIKGSTPLGTYHVDDSYDSWMDVESLNSLRFEQRLYEGGKHVNRNFDIFPGRGIFHQEGRDEKPSVPDPLDDASFFFFVRTLPLEVGKEYSFNKYFDPKANPVTIKVLRKEIVEVPAGKFPAIVLQPTFKTNGLFSEDGHAEIWLSDDEHRILLRMDTHFSIVKLGLTLSKATYGTPAPAPSH